MSRFVVAPSGMSEGFITESSGLRLVLVGEIPRVLAVVMGLGMLPSGSSKGLVAKDSSDTVGRVTLHRSANGSAGGSEQS
jgi:hypothetical protein